jgi:site-specific DNA-methyltransferase (adenine-specific)
MQYPDRQSKEMLKPYYQTKLGRLYHGDCLEIMPHLEPVDLVLTDPPYGITKINWDNLETFKKSIPVLQKKSSAQIVFGNIQMLKFLDDFKFEFIWDKRVGANFARVKYRPLRVHEYIFVCGNFIYNPILTGKAKGNFGRKSKKETKEHIVTRLGNNYKTGVGYPKSILSYLKPINLTEGGKHSTQKPITLLKYLVTTFTDHETVVLDVFGGSGTTFVACEYLDRCWIGIEIEEKYCEIAAKRIEKEVKSIKQMIVKPWELIGKQKKKMRGLLD